MKRAMVNNWTWFSCLRLHSPSCQSVFSNESPPSFFWREGALLPRVTLHVLPYRIWTVWKTFSSTLPTCCSNCEPVPWLLATTTSFVSAYPPYLACFPSRSVAWLPFVYALACWHFTNYLALNIRYGGCGRADKPGALFSDLHKKGTPMEDLYRMVQHAGNVLPRL